MQRSAAVDIHVVSTCEACKHIYEWDAKLLQTTSNAFSLVCKDPTPGLLKQVRDLRFGIKRCPKCKYLQSWMFKQWEDRRAGIAVLISFPFFLLGGYSIGWPFPDVGQGAGDFADILNVVLALGGYLIGFAIIGTPFFLLMEKLVKDPNKKWKQKHGEKLPSSIFPKIQAKKPSGY